eukprot:GFUD01043477.1.p1 GENE.GFUD01043477.1~~GFUD01043477.1.p1  ORF type:complete len:638 (-),score=151.19 GFUD01043477.1:153-2066(-)
MEQSNGQILNIPQYLNQRPSTDHEESDTDHMETESHTESTTEEPEEGGIGEFDDGKTGKLTLAILLHENLIQAGEKVMSIDYLGQTFKGDLMPAGKIRSIETGLVFNNPSAWAIYCKKIINPAKKSGCGWASVKYKGRKMDYYKSVWTKRKAQRDAENAKNEAAQALTALSASGGLRSNSAHNAMDSIHLDENMYNMRTNLLKATSLSPIFSNSKGHFVELESFTQEGKMQPFTVSVSTSAMLILDLHSHLSDEEVCGYLAGQWDPNSHNLAITNTFPCLIDPKEAGTEAAQKLETDIYEDLYGKHLNLVGWYHSNPKGPAAPSAKDCFDQLDFQIKLLGHSDSTYTPCVGLICAPYQKDAKTSESSIVVYWIYPPAENSNQEFGKPMRMSYSAITDPCLSEEVIQQIDKTIAFFKKQPRKIPFNEKYDDEQFYINKIGKSLVSKFPQDQNEQLWRYIQSQLMEGLEVQVDTNDTNANSPHTEPNNHVLINGRKNSEEEEIDDDEETALNEEQEEIDDDEETAIVERSQEEKASLPQAVPQNFSRNQPSMLTISQFSPMGTHMTFTRNQDGGQEVNLSIQETDQMQETAIAFPEMEVPLALTKNGSSSDTDIPLNFSSNRHQGEDEDSDEGRLVIKE